MIAAQLDITRLGQRGEGFAVGPSGPVYVPYALPGDSVLATVDGEVGHIVDLLSPGADRIPPICPYFGTCGGCAVQGLVESPYRAWKRGLVVDALARAGIAAEVAALVDAHGEGRRRATLHARWRPTANVLSRRDLRVGFMRARAHEVVDIDVCPIFAPGLLPALPAVRRLAEAAAALEKPLDVIATATETGLDLDLRGLGTLPERYRRELIDVAATMDVARLSNHGDTLIERRPPIVTLGRARVALPPGGFLQATARGEAALGDLVRSEVGPARKVADLFCGLGTFSLALAETATLRSYDLEGPALVALGRAAQATASLRPVSPEARDLFRRPLTAAELSRFDAVVLDPPRAGAPEQAEALAGSKVPVVVAVSCNPVTFARDAATLLAGGYEIGTVTPVDQFRYAPHVEVVAAFRRAKVKRPRPLFG